MKADLEMQIKDIKAHVDAGRYHQTVLFDMIMTDNKVITTMLLSNIVLNMVLIIMFCNLMTK